MKVPLSWLREYVELDLPVKELANRLTLAGCEVVGIEKAAESWPGIVIGRVVKVEPHPNADRLHLATVDLGGEEETVVCGAPNVAVGQKVPFARVGATVYDGHTGQRRVLGAAKIRGVISRGMICSQKELGIGEEHEGIMILPEEASVGQPFADFYADTLLDLAITPNRPDLLSILGVAREVAALSGKRVREPVLHLEYPSTPVHEAFSVEIAEPGLCRRYSAALVRGVKVGESPQWLKDRLTHCGMRPINNIVDITNYVMLEYGQPLHGFDFEKLNGGKIIVRRAAMGETIRTLDDVERKLTPDVVVIADAKQAVAVAGVMGGMGSEVGESTKAVLIESASFNAASIHATGEYLGITSEARSRFERGLSPNLTLVALRRAVDLILSLAGGVATSLVDNYPVRVDAPGIDLSRERLDHLLGVSFSNDEVMDVLERLGFSCDYADGTFRVTPPYWRSDIRLDADVVEEVARIKGYDRIPVTMLSSPIPHHQPSPMVELKERLKDIMAGLGFREILSYSLVSSEGLWWGGGLSEPAIALVNPISREQNVLRTNLRGGLLQALALNHRYGIRGIRLFELGRVYLPAQDKPPREVDMMAALLSGYWIEPWWRERGKEVDFFTAKGVVEAVLRRLGLEGYFSPGEDGGLHPHRQAQIRVGDVTVGVVGELHPANMLRLELPQPTYLFEMSLEVLLPLTQEAKGYRALPRFPAVVRDFAFILPESVSYGRLAEFIKGQHLVERVELFDLYRGDQVTAGNKSLAIRVTFRAQDHTLTDSEVDEVQKRIVDDLSRELGARLRG